MMFLTLLNSQCSHDCKYTFMVADSGFLVDIWLSLDSRVTAFTHSKRALNLIQPVLKKRNMPLILVVIDNEGRRFIL